jgi:uncharacterized protein YwqG
VDIEAIRAALRAAGLDSLAEHAERLVLLMPAIRITPTTVDESQLPIGASKIGGHPDLPPEIAWPMRDGMPLGFLAQFDLMEVARYDVDGVLPPSGMLSFFYDFATAPWGLYPEDRGGWQVQYFERDKSALTQAEWPDTLAQLYRLPAHRPEFSPDVTWTQSPEWAANVQLSDAESHRLDEVYAGLVAADAADAVGFDDAFEQMASRHQLLGHPSLIEGSMALECELCVREQPNSAWEVISKARKGDEQARAQLVDAYGRWRLLFQLGNVSGLPLPQGPWDEDDPVWRLSELCGMWARGGLMSFWIENDRLACRDFSNVRFLGASQL